MSVSPVCFGRDERRWAKPNSFSQLSNRIGLKPSSLAPDDLLRPGDRLLAGSLPTQPKSRGNQFRRALLGLRMSIWHVTGKRRKASPNTPVDDFSVLDTLVQGIQDGQKLAAEKRQVGRFILSNQNVNNDQGRPVFVDPASSSGHRLIHWKPLFEIFRDYLSLPKAIQRFEIAHHTRLAPTL